MITRKLAQIIQDTFKKFPILGIMGPRQSGKTTLAKALFPNFNYINLENPDDRATALTDPRGFLSLHKPPIIFDEIQNTPLLFSYLQELVDTGGKNEQYIITGSQNFVLNQKISQTLAGRIYLVQLPTLTLSELEGAGIYFDDWHTYAFRGSYPRVWKEDLTPAQWYPSYVQTYLERDVRDLKNIVDLKDFQTFMGFCAGRGGQELVLSSIAGEMGISHNTVKAWLSVLEASHLIYLLKPYYKNLNKRLVKTPKLYFLDTGLMLYLLNITSSDQLNNHPLRGNIFENLVVSEILKSKTNLGYTNLGYYIRDRNGNKVDYAQEKGGILSLTEIKASQTFSTDFLKGIRYWSGFEPTAINNSFVVFAGNQEALIEGVKVVNFKNLDQIINLPI